MEIKTTNIEAFKTKQFQESLKIADETQRLPQAEKLLNLCEHAELFHTPDGESFATISVSGHRENWSLKSQGFRHWLTGGYYHRFKSAPSSQSVQDAIGALAGKAQFEGAEHEVHLRTARHNDKLYIDLANNSWQAVEIDQNGWRVIENPPARFRRPKGMAALPTPVLCDPPTYAKRLQAHLNIDSMDDFKLTMAWIMAALVPEGPFPILVPYGEQGTGKSTLVKAIRSLIDPNNSPLRREPKTADDLMVGARNNWILAFDNISRLSDDLSDDICRLSTGGGLSKRELYTDDGEIVLSAKRPCILNGIEEFITRGDAADRSIVIHLPTIPENKRMREEIFWREFEMDRPAIFGAICTAISHGLRVKDTFELSEKPRMADAFHWATATETVFGWEKESTLSAFFENQRKSNEIVLESSPLFKYLNKYADEGFKGTPQLLLENIRGEASNTELRFLPANAISLGNKLRRLTPALKRVGIEVVTSRTATDRKVELRKSSKKAVTVVTPVIPARRYAPSSDDHDTHDDLFPTASGFGGGHGGQ